MDTSKLVPFNSDQWNTIRSIISGRRVRRERKRALAEYIANHIHSTHPRRLPHLPKHQHREGND